MARQLVFDLPFAPAFGAEDFLVGASNEQAFGLIESWPDWPDSMLRLEGPAGSGKSHLASIWAERAGAAILPALGLTADRVPALSDENAVLVEDLERGVADERALFHLINVARERGRTLLVTSSLPPESCGLAVPDLLSRLRRSPVARLEPPDDALLRSVLVKLFHDRQLHVEAAVIAFVASRIERSFAAAAAIVAALDREALSRGRRVTRAIAAPIVAAHQTAESEDDVHPSVTRGT